MKIKKQKTQKKCVIKRKTKFENYKNCLESTQLENKINHLENNKTDIDFVKKHEECGRHVFTEEIRKIALSSNDDKRMQSIDLIETYVYESRRDLVSEKKILNVAI